MLARSWSKARRSVYLVLRKGIASKLLCGLPRFATPVSAKCERAAALRELCVSNTLFAV